MSSKSRRDSNAVTKTGRGNAAGRPGTSARVAYRYQRMAFLRMSWPARIMTLLLAAGAGAVVGHSAGYPVWESAGVAASIFAALWVLLWSPNALLSVIVTAVFLPVWALLGGVLIGRVTGYPDALGGFLGLFVTVLIGAGLAVRYSRGRVWLTLLYAQVAAVLGGALISNLLPSWGLNAARLPFAIVILARCGGWAWLSGTVALTWGAARAKFAGESAEVRPVTATGVSTGSAWLDRSVAEMETARILSALPKGYYSFHDVRGRKFTTSVPHLVIGPSGVMLLASVSSPGPLRETTSAGLTLAGVNLEAVVARLMENRTQTAKAIGCRVNDISLGVVVHDAVMGVNRRVVAVFDPKDLSAPAGQLLLVSADALTSEINCGIDFWSPLKVSQVARRARLRLAPAHLPALEEPTEELRLEGVDEQGRYTHIPDVPSWITHGASVTIPSEDGTPLSNLRVVGRPYLDKSGRAVVDIVIAEAFAAYDTLDALDQRKIRHALPVDRVHPGE